MSWTFLYRCWVVWPQLKNKTRYFLNCVNFIFEFYSTFYILNILWAPYSELLCGLPFHSQMQALFVVDKLLLSSLPFLHFSPSVREAHCPHSVLLPWHAAVPVHPAVNSALTQVHLLSLCFTFSLLTSSFLTTSFKFNYIFAFFLLEGINIS